MIKVTKDQQEQVKEAKADIEMQINKVKDAISEIYDVLNAPADLATGLCIGASKIAEGVANFFVNIGNIFVDKDDFDHKEALRDQLFQNLNNIKDILMYLEMMLFQLYILLVVLLYLQLLVVVERE